MIAVEDFFKKYPPKTKLLADNPIAQVRQDEEGVIWYHWKDDSEFVLTSRAWEGEYE